MKKFLIFTIIMSIMLMNVNAYASTVPPVAGEGAILLDANSGTVLYEKNIHKKFYPASITKIMTALLVLENCKLDDKVIIGKNPSSFIDGNKIYVFEDEEFTVDQLLHALLIESANDVAIALAEHVSGSVEEFAKLMNKRAAELGCYNTNFVNPNGLHDDNHYTTAYDMSLITREAMKNPTFREIITTETYTIQPTNKQPEQRHFWLSNWLISDTRYHVEGANGVKTGFTDEAHHTIVGSAVRGDTNLLVVLLSDPSKVDMYKDASSLLKYGFDTYKTVKEVSEGDVLSYYNVPCTDTRMPMTAKKDWYYTYRSDKTPELKTEVVLSNNIDDSSISKGQVLGYVEYRDAGELVGAVDLLSGGSYVLPKNPKVENSLVSAATQYHFQWIFTSVISLILSGYILGFMMRNQTLN